MIRAGLTRAAKLFAGVAAASAAGALLLGLLLGASASRAVSVGWYSTGVSLLLLGFLASSRGPTRAVEGGVWSPSVRGRALRWATRTEQDESIAVAAVLILFGFVLIVLGVAVDPRHRLF